MKRFVLYTCSLSLLLSISAAQASVTVGGTRVIYDGSKKETSLSVENKDSVANLVQSWLVPADSAPKDGIIITPPLFRLNVGEKNVLRFVRSGSPLPEDRESLYWLNVKGIAATEDGQDKNTMQIAVNTRIKLIYRPAALKGTLPEDVANQVKWKIDGNNLMVTNPTHYYMNFATVKLNGKEASNVTYVAPTSTLSFTLSSGDKNGTITWRIYNDFGMAGPEHKAQL